MCLNGHNDLGIWKTTLAKCLAAVNMLLYIYTFSLVNVIFSVMP